MTGIVVVGIGIGGFIGPLAANWFISAYEWRISYIIVGILVFVVLVLVAQLLRRDPTQMGQVPYGQNEEQYRSNLGISGFYLKEAVYTIQFWQVFAMSFWPAPFISAYTQGRYLAVW